MDLMFLHCTNIGHSQYNNLETTGVLSNIHIMHEPRKTTTADYRSTVRAVKKDMSRRIEALSQDKNFSSAVIIRQSGWNLHRSTEMRHRSFGRNFYELIRVV